MGLHLILNPNLSPGQAAASLVSENEKYLGQVLDEEKEIFHVFVNDHHVLIEAREGVLDALFRFLDLQAGQHQARHLNPLKD